MNEGLGTALTGAAVALLLFDVIGGLVIVYGPSSLYGTNDPAIGSLARVTGATVRSAGAASNYFQGLPVLSFQAKPFQLGIDGQRVWAYEFPDEASADAQALLILPDGSEMLSPQGEIVSFDYPSSPHFFKSKDLIVLYVGEDQTTLETLTFALGRPFAGGQPTGTSAQGTNSTPQSARKTASSGMTLWAALNLTTVRQGGAIGVVAKLVNTLDHNLTLHPNYVTYSNVTSWGTYSEDVCDSNSLLNIAVFFGYYTADNISKAGVPLQLGEPLALPCPLEPDWTSIEVSANSSSAEAFSTLAGEPVATGLNLRSSLGPLRFFTTSSGGYGAPMDGASGYWTGGLGAESGGSLQFHYFSAGQYTVAAADLFGDFVLLHFRVT